MGSCSSKPHSKAIRSVKVQPAEQWSFTNGAVISWNGYQLHKSHLDEYEHEGKISYRLKKGIIKEDATVDTYLQYVVTATQFIDVEIQPVRVAAIEWLMQVFDKPELRMSLMEVDIKTKKIGATLLFIAQKFEDSLSLSDGDETRSFAKELKADGFLYRWLDDSQKEALEKLIPEVCSTEPAASEPVKFISPSRAWLEPNP